MQDLSLFKDKHSRGESASQLGERGEFLAADYLLRNKYRIVCSNFQVPVGRNRRGVIVTGEIDLIAYEEHDLCFIEVKTRKSDTFASPLAAVDIRKQRQITRTARMYRKILHLDDTKFRYDVVTIILKDDVLPKIQLIKGFWTEQKFRKTFWSDEG